MSQRVKKLTESVRSRVKPEEKREFLRCASGQGLTLSQWVRHVCAGAVSEVVTRGGGSVQLRANTEVDGAVSLER